MPSAVGTRQRGFSIAVISRHCLSSAIRRTLGKEFADIFPKIKKYNTRQGQLPSNAYRCLPEEGDLTSPLGLVLPGHDHHSCSGHHVFVVRASSGIAAVLVCRAPDVARDLKDGLLVWGAEGEDVTGVNFFLTLGKEAALSSVLFLSSVFYFTFGKAVGCRVSD